MLPAKRGVTLALTLMWTVVACGGPGASPAPNTSAPTDPSPVITSSPGQAGSTPSPQNGTPDAASTATPALAPTGTPADASPVPSPEPSPGLTEAEIQWTQITGQDGPSAREDHTFTVDDGSEAAYLFGGRAGQRASDELWRYDLATDSWQLVEVDGPRPEARFGHVAAWLDGRGLVVWSGQQSARVFFADTWLFDPQEGEWQRLPDGGAVPEARYGSCGGIGPDGRLWISHGFTEDSGRFFDTRAYDFTDGTWADLTPDGEVPVLRCLHRCLWTPDGRFVLYAGQTTGAPAIGDLWSLDPSSSSWSRAEQPAADARQLYSIAQVGGDAVIFGGGSASGGFLDDVWVLDLSTLEMNPASVVGAGPSGRFGGSLIADPSRGRLLLFGGKGEAGELADLWQLSPAGP